jgi:hypothetical protein
MRNKSREIKFELTASSEVHVLEKTVLVQVVNKVRASLCNPKMHYGVHKTATGGYPQPHDSSSGPHTLFFLRSTLTLFSHLCPGLQCCLFRSDFPTKLPYEFIMRLVGAMSPVHLIFLELITLKI